MNKKFILLAFLFFLACILWAGDTAVFVDLGFSADGRTYMFGQYGVQSGTLRPWAELYAVDVQSNSFVPGGKISYTHDGPVVAGHDGAGALYRIIARNTSLADRYNVSYLLQGQLLYVSIENGVSPGGETIEFRDFEKADSFRATLVSSGFGTEGSSFSISLQRINRDGSTRTYTAGNAGIKRPGIVSYRIRRVLAAPRNGSLIFVIEMKKQNPDGSTDIRYMVETLKL
jgi:predicted secreted protein